MISSAPEIWNPKSVCCLPWQNPATLNKQNIGLYDVLWQINYSVPWSRDSSLNEHSIYRYLKSICHPNDRLSIEKNILINVSLSNLIVLLLISSLLPYFLSLIFANDVRLVIFHTIMNFKAEQFSYGIVQALLEEPDQTIMEKLAVIYNVYK